ncbi:MAG: dihydropteroate synthase, partial [Akkermansiaceae bacterium]|nr:dihydropteroate synthase [Akkermansiaceae bacterium]
PGIGFGKPLEHNLTLLRDLPTLAPDDHPLLLGISRKSFLSKISNSPTPTDRDASTIALTTLARQQGIMLHRVHDTQSTVRALRTVEGLLGI